MENLHGLPRRRKWAVRVAAVGAGAAVALLGLGSPASADVSLLPTPTTQGGAANLTFRVTNDSAVATVNRIEIRLPEDNPIAEVYRCPRTTGPRRSPRGRWPSRCSRCTAAAR